MKELDLMKLGNEELRYLRAMEEISGVNARDCLVTEKRLTYIVQGKDFGKAIGKNGRTVKELTNRIGKSIELFEYTPTAEEFVKKALNGIKIDNAELNSGEKKTITISIDSENRRKLQNSMGRLKRLKEIVKREYDIDDIRVK